MRQERTRAAGRQAWRRAGGSPRRSRSGTLYVATLGVTLIVAMIALASSTLGRLELRQTTSGGDAREARALARSAAEYGLNWIAKVEGWRTVLTSGAEQGPYALGSGTMSWVAIDEDGDLADEESDEVTLRGIGRVGDVVAVEEVTLTNNGPALTCLEAAVHTDKHLDLKNRTLTTNQAASSNGEIKNDSGQVNGNVWTADSVESNANVSGTISANQTPAREMPDSATVWNYYLSKGTYIPISAIDTTFGTKTISSKVVSPASNPWGETNPEGIYIIDCEGQKLNILWSRFVGTLVLLNVGADSGITAEVEWEPAVPNYPSLMVQGDFTVDMTGLFGNHALWEGTLFTNFNPPGTPWEGVSDNDISDITPGWIRGLVYVSGLLEIDDESYFDGVVVADDVHLDASATFNYRDTFLNNPPPGFAGPGEMEVESGSWVRAAY